MVVQGSMSQIRCITSHILQQEKDIQRSGRVRTQALEAARGGEYPAEEVGSRSESRRRDVAGRDPKTAATPAHRREDLHLPSGLWSGQCISRISMPFLLH